jgi:hypothetical protein
LRRTYARVRTHFCSTPLLRLACWLHAVDLPIGRTPLVAGKVSRWRWSGEVMMWRPWVTCSMAWVACDHRLRGERGCAHSDMSRQILAPKSSGGLSRPLLRLLSIKAPHTYLHWWNSHRLARFYQDWCTDPSLVGSSMMPQRCPLRPLAPEKMERGPSRFVPGSPATPLRGGALGRGCERGSTSPSRTAAHDPAPRFCRGLSSQPVLERGRPGHGKFSPMQAWRCGAQATGRGLRPPSPNECVSVTHPIEG